MPEYLLVVAMEPVNVRSLAQRREPFVFTAVTGIFALQCYTIASITFLYYDHLITFPQELRKIWKRRLSFLNILFIINRYTTCLGYIPIVYFIFRSPANTPMCNAYVRYPAVLSIITQIIITLIVTLRCYALYNCRRWILVPVTGLGFVVLGAFAWATTNFVGVYLDFGGLFRTCSNLESGSKRIDPFIVAWILSIVFDGTIFGLTLYRTIQLRRVHKFSGTYGSLANLLLRDGGVYFVVMALSYTTHIILFVYFENLIFGYSTGNNAFLTHTVSVTMMSRLILNMNSYGDKQQSSVQPNGDAVVGLQPSAQFTTDISSWIARTALEFRATLGSEEGSGGMTLASSALAERGFVLLDEEVVL